MAAAGFRVVPAADVADADALVVFGFGAGSGGDIGAVNRRLAEEACRWPSLPVLAQTEAARVLAADGRAVIDLEDDLRSRRRMGRSTYVDTSMIAQAAARLVRDAGWCRVGVIAHPAHAARCGALLARHGVEPTIAALRRPPDFDRRSTQWWTRSRTAWVAREIAVVAHHRVTGRLR